MEDQRLLITIMDVRYIKKGRLYMLSHRFKIEFVRPFGFVLGRLILVSLVYHTFKKETA